MSALIMCKGLPGSGKSTWAREYVLESAAGRVLRINKDDLRDMLHAGRWHKTNERQILAVRDLLIAEGLTSGQDVIVDDTNLHPKHEERLRELAGMHSATFDVQDFTNVPIGVCIDRDLKRPRSVGAKVIRKMHQQYLAPVWDPPAWDPAKPGAIIVDIDGTLAHMQGRSPYDYSRVHEDAVDATVRGIVTAAVDQHGLEVLVVSGRKAECRDQTLRWLAVNDVPFTELWMRADGDNRDDAVVKGEIFEENIAPRFNVHYVLDDRDRVVAMWRARGLKVLQVAEGDF